jgi:penicillin-binding protein 1A
LLRLAVAVMSVVTLLAVALVALLAGTPQVAGAPARVDAILAAHESSSDEGVIPTKLAEAVLATEDSRFYGDPALDAQGVGRGAWGIVTRNASEGGATIEVQLAKLLYTPGQSGPVALAKQIVIATKLDQNFTKKQILAMYLDAAYFGDGAYGITSAAEHYFGVTPGQLSWGQASLLAGLVQAPSAYNPRQHLSKALVRRRHVLKRLVAVHDLTQAQATQVTAEPLSPAVTFSG